MKKIRITAFDHDAQRDWLTIGKVYDVDKIDDEGDVWITCNDGVADYMNGEWGNFEEVKEEKQIDYASKLYGIALEIRSLERRHAELQAIIYQMRSEGEENATHLYREYGDTAEKIIKLKNGRDEILNNLLDGWSADDAIWEDEQNQITELRGGLF